MSETYIEKFTNNAGELLVVSDKGIYVRNKKLNLIVPRNCIRDKLKCSFGSILIKYGSGAFEHFTFIYEDRDKERLKKAIEPLNETRKLPYPEGASLKVEDFGIYPEPVQQPKEYRMRCKVCGHIYCYTSDDYLANEQLKKEINSKELSGALTTLFTSQTLGSSRSQEAEMMKMRIKDFSRCPKCNSADIQEIPDDEQITPEEKPGTPAVSAMDELKKLKELLDLGIVTQEEFDVKKKQLLGL